MSGRLDHVGLVVADLDRSLAFYRDLIGLPALGRGAESDPRYAEMLGVSRARFTWAELDLGEGHVLELLRFDEPASEAPGGVGQRSAGDAGRGSAGVAGIASGSGGPPPANGPPGAGLPGSSHFGIRVDEIDTLHEALVQSGATVIARPIELVEDNQWLGARVFYTLDPDGHLVELIER